MKLFGVRSILKKTVAYKMTIRGAGGLSHNFMMWTPTQFCQGLWVGSGFDARGRDGGGVGL